MILSDTTTTNCSFSQAVFAIHFACQPCRRKIGITQHCNGNGKDGNGKDGVGLDGMTQNMIPQSRTHVLQSEKHAGAATGGVVRFIHGAARMTRGTHLQLEFHNVDTAAKQQPSRATVGVVRFNQWQCQVQPVAVSGATSGIRNFQMRIPSDHLCLSAAPHQQQMPQSHLGHGHCQLRRHHRRHRRQRHIHHHLCT